MENQELITELLNDSNIESLFKTNESINGNEDIDQVIYNVIEELKATGSDNELHRIILDEINKLNLNEM